MPQKGTVPNSAKFHIFKKILLGQTLYMLLLLCFVMITHIFNFLMLYLLIGSVIACIFNDLLNYYISKS